MNHNQGYILLEHADEYKIEYNILEDLIFLLMNKF